MNDCTWLSISLFCNRSNWHILLKKGIRNYISTLTEEGILMSYRVELNYYSGENIRLSLLVKEKFAAKVAKNADEYFKLFFEQMDFPVHSSCLNKNSLFMPFATNTIRYGLYKIDPQKNTILTELDQTISRLLTEVLANDIIDDDCLLTFAYYLHAKLLKLPFWDDAEKNSNLKYLSNYVKSLASDLMAWGLLKKKYEENKNLLKEICADTIGAATRLEWLRSWAEACQKSLLKLNETECLNTFPYLKYQYFLVAINGILGITVNMQQILSYFLLNSIYIDSHDSSQISINQSLLD